TPSNVTTAVRAASRVFLELVGCDAALTAVVTLLGVGVETGFLDERSTGDHLENARRRRPRPRVHVELLVLRDVARVREHPARLHLDHDDAALGEAIGLHLRADGTLQHGVEGELSLPTVR